MADGKFLGLLDMIDGGGAGKAGDQFEGGIFSGLLNGIGVRPFGYGAKNEGTGVDVAMENFRRKTGALGGSRGIGGSGAQVDFQPQAPVPTPTSLQPVTLGYGLPVADIRGVSGANLAYGVPVQPLAMPDLIAPAQANQTQQAGDAFARAMRHPLTSPGTASLSSFFQQQMQPRT